MESPNPAPEVEESPPAPEATPAELPPQEEPAAALAAPVIRYGGFWRRSGAFLLDGFVIAIASVPATILTLVAYASTASTIATIVTVPIGFAYLPFCWARWGTTIGMALMGLRVVRLEDLQRISWWRALGRLLALYPASVFLGLGIIWVGWEPRKRGWHDRLADTLVLRVPSLRERGDPRRRWALAAVLVGVVSWIFSVAVGITFGIAAATHGVRNADGDLLGSQILSLSALQAGDCFDLFLNSIDSVTATRCSELHTYEVFGTAKLPTGARPSDDELQQLASDKCIPLFARYVGIPFDQSAWFASYIVPDPGSWLLGNRTLTCYLANEAEAKIRGSARDSEQ
jgi:uncharacterized RDD family membrane protein YckC